MVTWAIILLGISIVGMLGLGLYYLLTKKKYESNALLYSKDKLLIKNKSGIKDTFDSIFQVIYLTFIKMPILKYYTKKTRLKFEMTNDYDEYEIRRVTGKSMFIALVTIFISLAILINLVDDLYMTLIILVGVIIIAENQANLINHSHASPNKQCKTDNIHCL